MSIVLGQPTTLSGNVTTLQWIKPGYEGTTEDSLGYHQGRLAQGYWVMLLQRLPTPKEFAFDGTTMRSGGRVGLPLRTTTADALRPKVHDQIMAQRGAAGYQALQQATLGQVSVTGDQRIAKVLPAIRHSNTMAPADQYPMGGGGLQWVILPPGLPFLAAAEVRADGTVTIPGEVLNLRTSGYEARVKLRRYLVSA